MYPPILSSDAIYYASQALRAQAKYLEIQSAGWLILAEQGEKEAARTIDAEVADMSKPEQWINRWEFMMIVISSIRDSDQEKVDGVTLRVQSLLERYNSNEKRWMCTSEILAAEATMQLLVIRKWLGKAVVEGARKGTPFLIRQSLLSLNLDVDVEIIDKYLVEKGLLIPSPESIAIVDAPAEAADQTTRSRSPSPSPSLHTANDGTPAVDASPNEPVNVHHTRWSRVKNLFRKTF